MKTTIAEGAVRHFSAEAYARRKAAEKAAMGILSETWDIENCTAATMVLISGRLYLTKVGVCAGDPITKVLLRNNTALSAGTLFKVGLFSVAGDGTNQNATCLAVSTDQTATFGATGPKNVALAYVPPEDDMLYVGTMFTGTTGPALYARLGSSVNGNSNADTQASQTKNHVYNLSGQTDIAVGQVFSTLAADGNCAQIYAALRA